MEVVRNNAEDLRAFAEYFENFCANLEADSQTLQNLFDELSQIWRDRQNERMSGKMEAFRTMIRDFNRRSAGVPDHLRALANLIDDYDANR